MLLLFKKLDSSNRNTDSLNTRLLVCKIHPNNKNNQEKNNNQNEILFILGKAISEDPIIKGTNQFPKPPIKIGITTKKIIKNPCPVTNKFPYKI
jgi:hypothetical protein